jgi:hypothetical protein
MLCGEPNRLRSFAGWALTMFSIRVMQISIPVFTNSAAGLEPPLASTPWPGKCRHASYALSPAGVACGEPGTPSSTSLAAARAPKPSSAIAILRPTRLGLALQSLVQLALCPSHCETGVIAWHLWCAKTLCVGFWRDVTLLLLSHNERSLNSLP